MKFQTSLLALFVFIYAVQAYDYKLALIVSPDAKTSAEGTLSGLVFGEYNTQRLKFKQRVFGEKEKLLLEFSFPEEISLVILRWNSASPSTLRLNPIVVLWDSVDKKERGLVFYPDQELISNNTLVQFTKA